MRTHDTELTELTFLSVGAIHACTYRVRCTVGFFSQPRCPKRKLLYWSDNVDENVTRHSNARGIWLALQFLIAYAAPAWQETLDPFFSALAGVSQCFANPSSTCWKQTPDIAFARLGPCLPSLLAK